MKKILVIGLGSMGKRRVRNLQALGVTDITGVDMRADRRKEANEKYGISVSDDLDKTIAENKFDAWIISLPPAIHHTYIKKAIENRTACFVEASVLDTDFDQIITDAAKHNVVIAPSATLYFHPAIKLIRQLVQDGSLGKITNVLYHSGQYLPDWHTYEPVADYYVSNPATGGGREIVPFEFTWLSKVFGFPQSVAAIYKKTIDIEGAADIEDTYNLLLDYPGYIINLTVDVVSRAGTRRLTINGNRKQLYWNWDDNNIKIFDPEKNEWETVAYESVAAETGYNKNITEQMYIDEVKAFLDAAAGIAPFPNDMEHDKKVLGVLYKAEDSYKHKSFVS